MLKAAILGLTASLFVSAALAEERPTCPTGNTNGWQWSYDEDHIWLTDPEVDVSWTLESGQTGVTKGVTLVWYYSPWTDNKYVTYQKDGAFKLQNGLYIKPLSEVDGNFKLFSNDATDSKHDYFKALLIDGESVIEPDFDWESGWKPGTSKSVYISESKMPAAGRLKGALEAGGSKFELALWTKASLQPANMRKSYGRGAFVTRPIGNLIEQLKPKMISEAERARSTGIYCIEADY